MRSLNALLLLSLAAPVPALACAFDRGEVHEANLYFELGTARVGMNADETLKMFAANFIGCEVLYIASGHIDASELDSDPALGQSRADVARQRLQAEGVPERDILVRDLKHDSPAKPTDAGVREPFNRRVELIAIIR